MTDCNKNIILCILLSMPYMFILMYRSNRKGIEIKNVRLQKKYNAQRI